MTKDMGILKMERNKVESAMDYDVDGGDWLQLDCFSKSEGPIEIAMNFEDPMDQIEEAIKIFVNALAEVLVEYGARYFAELEELKKCKHMWE